ncbi:Transposase [Shigella boydii ATCC 9905]|nr:Transposase [Shigella boydii ATCC 9905]
MSINIDGRDCCQTGQFSQDVADGALTKNIPISTEIMGWVALAAVLAPKSIWQQTEVASR